MSLSAGQLVFVKLIILSKSVSLVFFFFLNATTRKFKITYVAHVVFLLDNTGLGSWSFVVSVLRECTETKYLFCIIASSSPPDVF